MAIDTETKRRSAQYGTPGGQLRPVADGTVGTSDRAHCAWLYSGLTYSSPTVLVRRVIRQLFGLKFLGASR